MSLSFMGGLVKSDQQFLPVTREEMDRLGWEQADVILVSGDAYVDHPAFGTAVLARIAAHCGLRVAVLPQPNWRDDLRDFKKLGPPKYFFGVSAGSMDSMVNHYTARRRKRSEDAYTPGGRPGYRPDMASVVYTRILKQLYPDTPVVLGGVEASMRRFSHYDYWEDRVRPSVLVESGADMLLYGMAEMPFIRLIELLERGVPFSSLHNLLQTAFVTGKDRSLPPLKGRNETVLPSHENCLSDKRVFADTFRIIEASSNRMDPDRLIQPHGEKLVVVNPPFPLPDQPGADLPWDLPYTRLPHPKYQKKPAIPAYEMIKHSVTLHRGCFGGCSFCAIAAHQGKFISSRSERSVLQELEKIVQMPGFKGHITDLGGPTANMYRMGGKDLAVCRKCRRPSCIFPNICHNLDYNHNPLIRLYDKALAVPGVKKMTIGSGIRYDMLEGPSASVNKAYGLDEYTRRLLLQHVSGRLKVAPEHTEKQVLKSMRKPPFSTFERFHSRFRDICRREGLSWQLIPYFISGHPGCRDRDMENLAAAVKRNGLRPEPVQEFTPTPMTLSTTMYYTGIDPYSGKRVFSARSDEAKKRQKAYFFDAPWCRGRSG
ncbi:MAG: YgiQ family radical SAM protein [Bacteroidales bacterium]